MATRAQQAEAAEAAEDLRRILKPGDTVWTVLRHVSRSGMRRRIDMVKIEDGGELRQAAELVIGSWESGDLAGAVNQLSAALEDSGTGELYLTGYASRVLNPERKQEYPGDGITADGAGMDMGFDLVYRLGHALWPDGYQCSGAGCGSNDHVNGTRETCQTCGGSGQRATAKSADGHELERHERSGTSCDDCHGYGQIRGPSPAADGKMRHSSGGYALHHRWL